MDVFTPAESVLATFLVVSITINITPGPDMMFVIAHTLSRGVRAGRMAALGIALGSLLQALLAIAGISALIAASGELLHVLTFAGAGYLTWVGLKIARGPYAVDDERRDPGARPFARGVITNLLNIKVVLFYVTLLPLFVRDDAGPKWQQVLFFGVLFNVLGTSVLLTVASAAGRAAHRLSSHQRILAWLSRSAGMILIALAITVIWEQLT